MKKKLSVLLLAVICLMVLAGCACEHEWIEANCTTPKTCALCEEIEGAPLGHSWLAATCAAPKTCENCGETEGEALPHEWADADCTNPKTCPDCGATEGEALGHEWTEATYDAPKTCTVCGETEGEALKRENLGYTFDEFAALLNTSLANLSLELEYVGVDEDNWPIYAVIDTSTGTELAAAVGFEPDIDGETVYSVLISADSTDEDAVFQMGAIAGVAMVTLDNTVTTEIIQSLVLSEPTIDGDMVIYSMEHNGLLIELYAATDVSIFWISPAA